MERRLLSVAVALIALHAIVDAFLAPEPGTSWDDHLLRGVSSLGILVVVALLYPQLRTGVRAAVAAVLGVLALVGAGLAIVDARGVGPRGEDWTGFLLIPVGLMLCVLAATLLWRSRKPGRLRHVRRLGIVLGSVLGTYWVVLPVALAILATHRPREAVEPADLGRPYEQVTLRTSDDLRLAAWYVPSQNGAAIISFATRKGKLSHARLLARHGYGVLLLDARGYDGSDGDPNLFGWGTTKDIDAAVAWLQQRADVQTGRIGGIGFSVGGEVMLEAAASDTALRAVVSEGAGERSIRESLIRGPRGWFALPAAAVQTAAVAVLSGELPPPSLMDVTPRIAPRPMLLIYAGRGVGGEELQPHYYEVARQPKGMWRIPEAGHTGGLSARPEEYERRVVGFFERTLFRGSEHTS
jgi:fermentation-respiration switch protein FrsA (DUF1100 family)